LCSPRAGGVWGAGADAFFRAAGFFRTAAFRRGADFRVGAGFLAVWVPFRVVTFLRRTAMVASYSAGGFRAGEDEARGLRRGVERDFGPSTIRARWGILATIPRIDSTSGRVTRWRIRRSPKLRKVSR